MTMNCVRPNVSAEEEFNHRTRNVSPAEIRELQRRGQSGDIAGLSPWAQEIARCWRDAIAEGATPVRLS